MLPLNRRTFVTLAAAGTGVATLLRVPGVSSALASSADSSDQKIFPKLQDALVLNNLGGIYNPNLEVQTEDAIDLDPRALKDALASGTTMINNTIGYVAGDKEPFEFSVRSIAHSNRVIENHSDHLVKVLSSHDILRAKKEGKIGILQGFQNAAMMGEDASRAAIFAGLGVRVIQLTYNIKNQIGSGSMVPENGGITDFGHDVIAELNANKVVIDLSHSGKQTCLDALTSSKVPICITHTGCRALADLPRNKTDDELKGVADRGGVVGIYFMPFLREDGFASATDVVAHIEHAINICGEDHVGIGTDGGTTAIDDLDAARERTAKSIRRRRSLGISAKGENIGVVPFVPDLSGPTQFQKLADMLYARGHGIDRIEKILGRNFFSYYKSVWGA
ncbi:peptidase M19 [Algimonas porphyrae]|uniref:Peptidase M19 n=2 Tax=Algimonas porphyrae TaxID=1128113 RepID=A0ABQ5V2A0_9PROT|nr:peptidase M19 [Algimonas porphyrae]